MAPEGTYVGRRTRMNPAYALHDPSTVFSPGLLFFPALVRGNIARAVEIAGDADRLRPHVKTHKTREIVRMQLGARITKHKCATLAEAEMLADCGAGDVLLAYPMVGPNCGRLARLAGAYPDCHFRVVADHPAPVRALSEALNAKGRSAEVLLDVDAGQHRTGLAAAPEAVALYELIDRLPALRPGGLHFYDGHHRHENPAERGDAVHRRLGPLLELRASLLKQGLPVPRVVLGGTPTFPFYASLDVPGLECAPGTCFLYDRTYQVRFADLSGFVPAALVLTRVVSRPTPRRVTLDLGTKAVASDPPLEQRCYFPELPDCEPVLHNEEHLVVETPAADRFEPGREVCAIPGHVCPTCALHRRAYVVEGGAVVDQWEIVARDRVLRF
jgi:D-serine deaminase-like pyridoxal phosphate-dependent protein